MFVEIGPFVYWLNQDKSRQVWINVREKREAAERTAPAETVAAPAASLPEPPAADGSAPGSGDQGSQAGEASPLAAVRLLLKETKRGGVAAEIGRIADQLGRTPGELLAALVGAGLKEPEKPRERPVFAEHAGEIFWLNRNAKGELWLNAKASKYRDGEDEGAAGRPSRRARGKKNESE